MSRTSHATLRYTALRLGIFAGCFFVVAILAYLGVFPKGIGRSNPLWIALLALVLSAPISYVVLRRQREHMSEQIIDGVSRVRQRVADNQSQEDAAVDAAVDADEQAGSAQSTSTQSTSTQSTSA